MKSTKKYNYKTANCIDCSGKFEKKAGNQLRCTHCSNLKEAQRSAERSLVAFRKTENRKEFVLGNGVELTANVFGKEMAGHGIYKK